MIFTKTFEILSSHQVLVQMDPTGSDIDGLYTLSEKTIIDDKLKEKVTRFRIKDLCIENFDNYDAEAAEKFFNKCKKRALV